ncbi:MAG: TetR family transcriptional regulator [Planctomycetota bacterium]
MVQTSETREAKREEILRRAAEVFREKGFHGAGMREIAAGLNMAPGALYYYFESKEDLLYTCQILSLRRLLKSARGIVRQDVPADEKLRRLVRAHLGHILGELGGSLAHVEFHALPPAQLGEVVAKRDSYERLVRAVISDGIETGLFLRTDVKLAALAVLGALNWTVVWWRPEGGRDLDAVAGQMADVFLSGLSEERK